MRLVELCVDHEQSYDKGTKTYSKLMTCSIARRGNGASKYIIIIENKKSERRPSKELQQSRPHRCQVRSSRQVFFSHQTVRSAWLGTRATSRFSFYPPPRLHEVDGMGGAWRCGRPLETESKFRGPDALSMLHLPALPAPARG